MDSHDRILEDKYHEAMDLIFRNKRTAPGVQDQDYFPLHFYIGLMTKYLAKYKA